MNAFTRYFTIVLQAIMAVQTVYPTLAGKSKSDIVVGLTALGAGFASATFPDNKHAQQVAAGASATVALLQAIGVLKKDEVPVTAELPQ